MEPKGGKGQVLWNLGGIGAGVVEPRGERGKCYGTWGRRGVSYVKQNILKLTPVQIKLPNLVKLRNDLFIN